MTLSGHLFSYNLHIKSPFIKDTEEENTKYVHTLANPCPHLMSSNPTLEGKYPHTL
ncbi:Uncharacterised protein [Bacteroides heparinolyticus]|uniref:Uncharacterized protein n=2 Tax=Prevotella heparinolytica TaxID=28113 RepID=A0A449I5Y1_9BACE|nr:Uncharacterised protein [Bacteroides heparinolyticus]